MVEGYLIIDVGTGNTRVGIASTTGTVLAVESIETKYYRESAYPDSQSFKPEEMFDKIKNLIKHVLAKTPDVRIMSILSTSQREGIVLIDEEGQSILGLPNIDNRGLEWESEIKDFKKVYGLTGRWPTTVFSALKLRGVKERLPQIWKRIHAFTSVSDWIGYEFTGELVYEPSQASETLLFDVKEGCWSQELCDIFSINYSWLPRIQKCGSVLGKINPELASELNLSPETIFIVGGADTQLAVKGGSPQLDDIVIVSGTTTPIAKKVDSYSVDHLARCWVNRHVNEGEFIIETNAGVTGLNYQRLKKVFFPDKDYAEIEKEVLKLEKPTSIASFGTLVFDKNLPLASGGFLLDAPFNQDLTAADFVFGILFDIASSIKYNFDVMLAISNSNKDYVLGCGGGFQGSVLPQLLADLLQRKIIIKEGYSQASIQGGVIICNDALGIRNVEKETLKVFQPSSNDHLQSLYQKWCEYRNKINNINDNLRSEKVYAN
ncbi:FGGY-family carbohydrate kinase [Bacillus sp. Marseille-P3661]|uniref:FGGY-family carbohydrate kinase n=1 Tax=Bacillus sp. Marseille-P3661 TaxID=1936234 RepID=UPI000C8636BC|nr:FGGY family carbohydrate kinase [Bacillus sp. Marseille-P3661]